MDKKHKGECRTCWLLCCALAQMCAADPATVVDQLTGYLWDGKEAREIKANARPHGERVSDTVQDVVGTGGI